MDRFIWMSNTKNWDIVITFDSTAPSSYDIDQSAPKTFGQGFIEMFWTCIPYCFHWGDTHIANSRNASIGIIKILGQKRMPTTR